MQTCCIGECLCMKSIHTAAYRLLIEQLVSARNSAGITQLELSRAIKPLGLILSQADISKIENCSRRVDLLELRILCWALDVNFQKLVKGLDSELNLPNRERGRQHA